MQTNKKNLPAWNLRLSEDQAPPTPFYLYSEARLQKICEELHHTFAQFPIPLHHHFAFKANNNLSLLALLKSYNFGADVVSGNELLLALSQGYKANEIVFSGAGKTRRELELAIEKNIFQLNIESDFEFETLQKILKGSSKKVRISFRINPNVNAKSHPYISTGLKSHKFGLDLKRAKDLFERASLLSNFEVSGVSVHIGSQLLDLSPLREALEKTLDFTNTLSPQARRSIQVLDVGGGLGVDYRKPDLMPSFEKYAKVLKKIATRWKKECLHPQPKMICENGRSIVAQCGRLVTRVIGVKASSAHPFLLVDASMSELMRPALYQARHEISQLSPTQAKQKIPYTVVGPVCESSDSFGERFLLSKALKENDLLGIESVGAYGATMSHFYNARDLPAEYWLSAKNELKVSREKVSFIKTFAGVAPTL